MTSSMYLLLAMSTSGCEESVTQLPPESDLEDAGKPAFQRFLKSLREFHDKGGAPASPQAAFALEQRLKADLQELGRVGLEDADWCSTTSNTTIMSA